MVVHRPVPPPAHLALMAAALLLVGCSGSDVHPRGDGPATPRPTVEGPVVVLSTLDPTAAEPLWAHLRRQVRRLDLQVETIGDSELAARTGTGGVDLVLSARTGPIEQLAADGLLAPLPEQVVALVPEQRVGAGRRWLAIGLRARVIVAHRMLANKPRYVTDLSETRFRGRVARSPMHGDGFVAGMATLMADRAESIPPAFLAGLAANCDATVLPDDPQTVASVAERRADLALVDHTAFFRHVLGDAAGGPLAERTVAEASMEAIFPDSDGTGTAWSATGAGVAASASNTEGALVLLELLLSSAGQRAWADASLEYPSVEGVPATLGLPVAGSVRWSRTSLDELAAHRPGAMSHIDELDTR